MIYTKYFTSAAFFLNLFFAVHLLAEEGNRDDSSQKNIHKAEAKMIIGATELIKIEPPEVTLKARIDTGAKTTSIDARNIIPFERDGKKWVKFTVYDDEKEYPVERPVYDTVLIKRHGVEAEKRYMIKIRVTADKVSQLIPVSLTDRSTYEFPILIGRNFLKDYFIVDVSKNDLLLKRKDKQK